MWLVWKTSAPGPRTVVKYWQAPACASCRNAASCVPALFQSWTKSMRRPSASVKPATSASVAEACSERRAPEHIVDAPAAIGAEHVDGRDPLPEAGLSVGLDDRVEPGLERRDHRTVDGERLVDRDRAFGERRHLEGTRHAANARAVDLGRGDDGVGEGHLPAGEAGLFGLRSPDRPLGTAENPQLVRHGAAINTDTTGETRRAMARNLNRLA